MKKLLSFLVCLVMLCGTVIPLAAESSDVDLDKWQNPFTDVPEGKWFTEAVEYCNTRGLMNGTSETTFSPSSPITRAMLVTIIAAYHGADLTLYTKSPFDDVPEGKWYTAPVAWAAEQGIVSGVGNGRFAPERAINRQELATLLRTYAEYAGFYSKYLKSDRSDPDVTYADLPSVASWALAGMNWACAAGIISGAGDLNGSPTLAPLATATRAQAAVMIMKLDMLNNADTHVTINGHDLSEYKIVYSTSGNERVKTAADRLNYYIKQAYGYELPMSTDAEDPVDLEIIVGRTNREDSGLVTVDRGGESDVTYVINVQGDRLVMAGASDAEKRYGTYYAMYDFCEDVLGYHFYNDSTVVLDRVSAELGSDYELRGGPKFKSRVVYWRTGWDSVFFNDEYYNGANWVHELPEWIDPSLNAASATPCLSDEENIQKVISRVRKLLLSKGGDRVVWISQGDSSGYCRCEVCSQIYREEGSRGATIIRLCNRVNEALIGEFPDFRIATLAYSYTVKPPRITKPADNIIIYYCTDTACGAHNYDDETCPLNAPVAENVRGWSAIATELFNWDYSTNFTYSNIAVPNFYALRRNAEFFYENRTRGVFNNAVTGQLGEFPELRAFLLTRVYRDPEMSDEQYFKLMDGFLRAFYGYGWKDIRTFIDLIEKYSDSKHYTFNAPPASMFDMSLVEKDADMIMGLWEDAYAKAKTHEQREHVECSTVCALFLTQCALYDKMMVNGSDADRETYRSANDRLYDLCIKYGLRWSEDEKEIHFNRDVAPDKWHN